MDKKNIFIGSSETSVDVLELLFCGEGRDGKRQLQRRCGITFFLPVACKAALDKAVEKIMKDQGALNFKYIQKVTSEEK